MENEQNLTTDTPESQGSESISVEEAFFGSTEPEETGAEAPQGTPSKPQVDDVQA